MQLTYRYGSRHVAVTVQRVAPGRFAVAVDGRTVEVDATLLDPHTLRLVLDDEAHTARVVRIGDADHVAVGSSVYVLGREAAGGAGRHAVLAAPQIVAPMPGKVLQVLVRPGQQVAAGDGLLILEAMKMEHRIAAEAAATVEAVRVGDGEMVDAGTVLVELTYVPEDGKGAASAAPEA